MSRRGGNRLPRGHPNYHRQLARIRQWYQFRRPNEPPPDLENWQDIVEDEDLQWALDEYEAVREHFGDEFAARYSGVEGRDSPPTVRDTNEETRGTEERPTAEGSGQGKIDNYFKQTKRRAPDDLGKSEAPAKAFIAEPPGGMADIPQTEPMSTGGGGGGGGGAGGGGNSVIEDEMKFGMKTHVHTRSFKKSYLITVDNGLANLNLAQNGGTGNLQAFVIWNEGWQIIPWADIRAYLTPMDLYTLHMENRKFRIKRLSVRMEGIIPFQVDLTGGTNTTTATFNNRVNLHVYTDDGELLPDYNLDMDNIAHSELFTMPWGPGTTGALQSPTFAFNEATVPASYRYSVDNEFNPAKPQKFFSLYDTGCVKSVYPGQKYHKEWINPNSQWVGRPPNGVLNRALQLDAPNQEDLLLEVTRGCGVEWKSGVTGRSAQINQIPIDNSIPTNSKSNYIDTGLPMKMEGPPYILVRVEPYPNLGAGNGLINIYAQAHLHYEMDVEVMPLERPRTYVPIRTGTAQTQGTDAGFSTQLHRDVGYGITDNIIHRALGVARGDVVYT